jgi:hypothetical protein
MSRVNTLLKSKSAPYTYLPDGRDGNRKRRLLVIALQIPSVDNLLREIGRQKLLRAQERKWVIWKEFTVQHRCKEKALFEKKNRNITKIQCLVRCFLSRHRVQRRRLQFQLATELKRNNAALKIQSFFLCIVAKKRVQRMRRLYPDFIRDRSAILIQKVFRGFLGRAIVLNIERRKLLKFLRSWSRGKTGHLFHISGKFFMLMLIYIFLNVIS